MKEFCTLSPEDIETIKKAYQNAFGRKGEFHYDRDYPDVIDIDGVVAISPDWKKIEREALTGKTVHEEKRWFVETIQTYPATRWEPEDVDMVPVSDHAQLCEAIVAAFTVLIQVHVDNYFESLYYDQLAKELESEKKEVGA